MATPQEDKALQKDYQGIMVVNNSLIGLIS